MPILPRITSLLRNVFGKQQHDRELHAEVHSYVDLLAEEKMREGMSPEEARRAARIELGGIEQVKENVREARAGAWLDSLLQDLRYGARMLRKNPGFTAIAVLTLGLGIAANATIFSIVSAALLRKPPVVNADRVVMVMSTNPAQTWGQSRELVSAPNLFLCRNQNRAFEDIAAAITDVDTSLTGAGEPERVSSGRVTSNYFSLLGVNAILGRTFLPAEDQPGRDRVVILSEALWHRRYASDPNIVGKMIDLDGQNAMIVGVVPASFNFTFFHPQLWTALVLHEQQSDKSARESRNLYLLARLKPRITLQQARAEMVTLALRSEQSYPDTEKGWGATVLTLQDFINDELNIRPALVMLMAAVGFVLLIACANIAGLLLARSATRGKEMAIRATLGAARLRIVRQLLTEGFLIALLGGGGLGLLLSYWGINLLRASIEFSEEMSLIHITLDRNVLLFAFGLSVLSAFLFALAPAFHTTKTGLQTTLKSDTRAGSGGLSRTRLRNVLVSFEVALSLLLLTGTGLLIKGVIEGLRQDLGFDPQGLLTVGLSLTSRQYQDTSRQLSFFRDVSARVNALPGVESVALTSDPPANDATRVPFRLRIRAEVPPSERPQARHYVITPTYFRTANISLLRGRLFTDSDVAGAPAVVLVNEAFVRTFLPNEEPLGNFIKVFSGDSGDAGWCQIVGVVANVKNWPLARSETPQIYEPFSQRPSPSMSLLIRAAANPESLGPSVRAAVWAVDKNQPVGKIISMTNLLSQDTAGDRLMSSVLALFAGLAVLLTSVGIYGVVSHAVGQRTHEIGIRMALGAQSDRVLWLVVRQGMKLTLVGLLIGFAAALPLPNLLAGALIDFHVRALWIFAIAPASIATVSLLACFVPARRAMSVDPMLALRHE